MRPSSELDATFIPRQKPQRVTDVTSVDLTLDVAMGDALKEAYLAQVHAFARALPLAWGMTGNVESAYVHSRLGRIEPPTWPPRTPFNLERDIGNSPQAETLLFDEQLHVAIIAPTCGGKSALWRQWASRLAHGFVGEVLPVLIDWERIRAEKIVEANRLLESAIAQVVGLALPRQPSHFGRYRAGTGRCWLPLIDNRSGFNALPDLCRHQIFRQYSAKADGSASCFSVATRQRLTVARLSISTTALEDQDVRRFVRNWSLVSGKALNAEQSITWLMLTQRFRRLGRQPLVS